MILHQSDVMMDYAIIRKLPREARNRISAHDKLPG